MKITLWKFLVLLLLLLFTTATSSKNSQKTSIRHPRHHRLHDHHCATATIPTPNHPHPHPPCHKSQTFLLRGPPLPPLPLQHLQPPPPPEEIDPRYGVAKRLSLFPSLFLNLNSNGDSEKQKATVNLQHGGLEAAKTRMEIAKSNNSSWSWYQEKSMSCIKFTVSNHDDVIPKSPNTKRLTNSNPNLNCLYLLSNTLINTSSISPSTCISLKHTTMKNTLWKFLVLLLLLLFTTATSSKNLQKTSIRHPRLHDRHCATATISTSNHPHPHPPCHQSQAVLLRGPPLPLQHLQQPPPPEEIDPRYGVAKRLSLFPSLFFNLNSNVDLEKQKATYIQNEKKQIIRKRKAESQEEESRYQESQYLASQYQQDLEHQSSPFQRLEKQDIAEVQDQDQ
ncbi:hypothetical protein LXL04_011414 [Taraxacum kok-saghyz]